MCTLLCSCNSHFFFSLLVQFLLRVLIKVKHKNNCFCFHKKFGEREKRRKVGSCDCFKSSWIVFSSTCVNPGIAKLFLCVCVCLHRNSDMLKRCQTPTSCISHFLQTGSCECFSATKTSGNFWPVIGSHWWTPLKSQILSGFPRPSRILSEFCAWRSFLGCTEE